MSHDSRVLTQASRARCCSEEAAHVPHAPAPRNYTPTQHEPRPQPATSTRERARSSEHSDGALEDSGLRGSGVGARDSRAQEFR
eukprot:2126132-Rhodomonas_salina.1